MPGPERKSAAVLTSRQDLFGPVAESLPRVEQRMRELTVSGVGPIDDCFFVLLRNPGKMIRSGLLLLCARAAGARLARRHIDYAAIVEMVHTATLLHDDVIDQAAVRRGGPSANALWGNAAAVLLGDYLLSSAFAAGIKADVPAANRLLTETAGLVCRGELMQNLQSGNWNLAEKDYFDIIGGKTAALFACAAALGALLSDATAKEIDSLRQFGYQFGLAFQISDDLMDLLGTEKSLGKTAGIDLERSKPTLPVIHWLTSLGPRKRKQAARRLAETPSDAWVLDELHAAGSLDYARRVLAECSEKAAQSLAFLPENRAKSALIRLNFTLKSRI